MENYIKDPLPHPDHIRKIQKKTLSLAGTFLPKWRDTDQSPSLGKDANLQFPGSTV
jgi:hypothetical protein